MANRPPVHRSSDRPKAEGAALYDQARREDHRFYSSARWLKLRRLKLQINPLCEECERVERVTPAIDVDHIKPRREYPELELELSNLQSMCRPCHSHKTRTEQQ